MRKIKSFRQYFSILLSITLIVSAIGINVKDVFASNNSYEIKYEYINTKDMATAGVSNKKSNSNSLFNILFVEAVEDKEPKEEEKQITPPSSVELPVKKDSAALVVDRKIWYLPTEIGRVTQNPHYGHVALDITSYRGTAEVIHPVANGIVSGIYTDSAGALCVTVLHNINGQKYTSQYVHLSRYADGLYAGKQVTINDSLGNMGTTGNSTGVHLHLAVLDCALFDPNDNNCRDLGSWYRYDKIRFQQGYIGLGTMMVVPGEWYSR